ncbi:MAG: type II secretion system F family protein [Alicyclobacillus sp.]|nr:type II secretion system F family protein [Alicyclobacillus sp.]
MNGVRAIEWGARALLAAALALAAGGAALWLAQRPWFDLRRIEVRGELRHTNGAAVRAAVAGRGMALAMAVRAALRRLSAGRTASLAKLGAAGVQLKLARAGFPMGLSVSEWLGLRVALALAGAVAGLSTFAGAAADPVAGLAGLAGFCLLGWVGPDVWLTRRVRDRQRELLKQLPSVLDLLTVSVEAGLGFDQALARVADKAAGPLAEELERVLREMGLGSSRTDALQRMADRVGVDAVKSLVSSLIQADRLGVGLARVLRVQAAEVRRQRRMDAEERAMKAPVKMLFPLVAFVFPALFIVIMGPAVLRVMQWFGG